MTVRRSEVGVREGMMSKCGWNDRSGFVAVRHRPKKLTNWLWFALVLLLLWLGPVSPLARAQDTSITANVNKTDLSTDELVILTITVINDSPQQPRPLLTRLDGLAVVDLNLETKVTDVNGTLFTEVVFTYRLQPRRTGKLTIPPIPIELNDQILETPPLTINVTQGNAPLPSGGNEVNPDDIIPPDELAGQDFFIESLVDIQRPYIHQQIIHTFRFYQAIHLYQEPRYDEPLFTDFERVGLPVRQFNLDIEQRTYLITEIRTMLFPKEIGSLTIRPARMVLLGNFYEDPVEMFSENVTVEVQPLPDDAPAGFTGAVGQYKVKSWFSPKEAVINQPATFYIAISGAGNMNLLPEPAWPTSDWWRAYDTLNSLTTDVEDDEVMTGTRVFERLVVPGQLGEQTIPAVSFVYFDPLAAEYRTITTDPVPIEVIPAPTPAPTTPTPVPTAPVLEPTRIANADQPLFGNRADPVNPVAFGSQEATTLTQLPWMAMMFLGMCGLIPLAAVAGAGGLWLWQQRQRRQGEESASADEDLQQPSQRLHPHLAVAMKQSNDNHKVVSQAIYRYLETLLGRPVNGLTRTDLAAHLRQQGLETTLIDDIQDCLTRCEMERYGGTPTKEAGWSLMATADDLLARLDKATKTE